MTEFLNAAEGALSSELTATEKKLLSRFAKSEPARFETHHSGEPKETVRAELIRWILSNGDLVDASRLRGLHAINLRIEDDDLDLDGVQVDFPVLFQNCRLKQLLLRDARLITLKMSGTHCRGIRGDRMKLDHGLLLNEDFRSDGTVWLPAIRVGDDLNCDHGRFSAGEDRHSLLLDGAQIGGRLFLRRIVAAPAFDDRGQPKTEESGPADRGQVSIQGARIGGNLRCTGAKLHADGSVALHLGSTVVAGNGGFERVNTHRSINLRQTSFDGSLQFKGADVGGRLDLSRASIGGDLDLGSLSDAEQEKGRKRTRLGRALVLSGATVKGKFDLGDADLGRLQAVDLSRMSMGFLDDGKITWPAAKKVRLEGLKLDGIAAIDTKKRRSWLGSQNPDWSPQPFGQVVTALRLAGDDSRAREIAIRREKERRKRGGLAWITRQWSRLLGATISFGYRPYLAFGWALLFIAIGWAVFSGAFGAVEFVGDEGAPHRYALVYTIDAFLPIIDLGQASAWTPQGFWPNFTLWMEISFGWLLTTLGVVAVTGLVRRD